jgi:hypothetical protein
MRRVIQLREAIGGKVRIRQSVEVSEGICRFRLTGECSLVEAMELVSKALAYCRVRNISKLLVDGTDLVGVPIPSLVDRFLMVEEWAQEAQGVIAMVLVVRPEYIHPEKFGVKVAAHLGFTANVFSVESDALAWLAGVAQAERLS